MTGMGRNHVSYLQTLDEIKREEKVLEILTNLSKSSPENAYFGVSSIHRNFPTNSTEGKEYGSCLIMVGEILEKLAKSGKAEEILVDNKNGRLFSPRYRAKISDSE